MENSYAGIFIIFRALNFVRYCVMLCYVMLCYVMLLVDTQFFPASLVHKRDVTENCDIRRLQYFYCIYVFLLLCLCILIVCMFCSVYCFHRAKWHPSATQTEVFLCFFLSCKANARV